MQNATGPIFKRKETNTCYIFKQMALFYNAIFSAISKTHVVFSSVIYIVKKLLIKLLKQVESCTRTAAVIYSILSVECFFLAHERHGKSGLFVVWRRIKWCPHTQSFCDMIMEHQG